MNASITIAVCTLVACVACVACVAASAAPPIEVKGLQIGMTEEQIVAAIGSMTPRGLTIAGVPSFYADNHRLPLDPGVEIQMEDGKLARFTFLFKARYFEPLQQTFSEKYPAMRCSDSSVTTGSGARLTQTECELQDAQSRLSVRRFVGDINTAGLVLESREHTSREAVRAREVRRKDI